MVSREGPSKMRDDRQYINELTYSDIEFPICEKQYNKIEKQNNINVNIFSFEVKQFFPIYMSKEHFTDVLNLLLKKEKTSILLCTIRQNTKQENTSACTVYNLLQLQAYSKKQKADCIVIHGNQAIKIPDKNKTLKFNYIQKQMPVPFVICADLTP